MDFTTRKMRANNTWRNGKNALVTGLAVLATARAKGYSTAAIGKL